MIGWFRENITKRVTRSSGWSKVRKEHIRKNPKCRACRTRHNLHVHHKIPFGMFPEKELDPVNLITLCARCHLLIGHGGNWRYYSPNVSQLALLIWIKCVGRKMKI